MTKQQIIEMITLFYVAPAGCYEDEADEYPGAKEFIEAGYAEPDEEEPEFLVISEAGDEFLYPHIRQIAEDLVTFMYDAGGESTDEEIQKWINEKYELVGDETAQLLAFFMCEKLNHFGWEASRIYSSEKGWFRRLEELSDAE